MNCMEKIHLALCDDEAYYIEDIQKLLATYIEETGCEISADSYLSGIDLLKKLESKSYEIFFLDVDMPKIKGIDLGKEIKKRAPRAIICFVTAYQQYAYEAYQTEALGYLVKPVEYKELKRILDRSIEQLELFRGKGQEESSLLQLKSGRGMAWINPKEIVYLEKRKNQCVFHMEKDEVIIYMTLREVYTMLDPTMFYYTHQGYIVNFAKILEVKAKSICLKGNIEIPVSRKYQPMIRELHIEKIMQLGNG